MGILGNAWLSVTDFIGESVLYPALRGMGYSDEVLAGSTPEARAQAPIFHRLADGGETMTPMIREGRYVEAASTGVGTVMRAGGETVSSTVQAIPGMLGLDGMGIFGTIMWALGGLLAGGTAASMVFGGNTFMTLAAGAAAAAGAVYLGNAYNRGELGNLFSGVVDGVSSLVGRITGGDTPDPARRPAALPAPG